MLTISAPTLSDADALLAFEIENRAYFEQWINARAADYYSASAVAEAIEAALADIAGDRAYQYLVRSDDAIVGRVNLVGVTRPYFNKATLGYRIGAGFAGKGYASQAVKLAMELAATELSLSRIEAVVRPQNIGSMRVLERNGFVAFGQARRSMYLHGEWHDLVHYERHLDDTGKAPAKSPAKIPHASTWTTACAPVRARLPRIGGAGVCASIFSCAALQTLQALQAARRAWRAAASVPRSPSNE
ncbi:hypothetical protein BTH42_13930 [Burkholderia sp. SRS-W-2-2016]|uniref:GNAT family N-acetyltransferase n=1 Tax=Burkholderia sp. SRS-W-2-2016 TaxID=1926878 RepID=UPI00094B4B2A|nr:GNAT family protein [Burkholderia sp. SRS-W-2-2016]OLL31062.1 hypothetical protein BTH42_13930 [Burkholderia sp. SRS-W-2-2016]